MPRIVFPTLLALFTLVASAQEIKWMSWEEATSLSQTAKNPKKIFIDVYTDWCGYCKHMDSITFRDPEVARYMTDNFYMVKFNAEQKEPITFNGRTYSFVPRGRRGYHELAVLLLNGRLSYPTVVFMDEKMRVAAPIPGFRRPNEFLPIAKYYGEATVRKRQGPKPVRQGSR